MTLTKDTPKSSTATLKSPTDDSNTDDNNTTAASSSSITSLLDWNISASGSIGTLLLQMQKKEEELRKLNQTVLYQEQIVDLFNLNRKNETILDGEGKDKEEKVKKQEMNKKQREMAKELDDAVKIRLTPTVGKEVEILDLPPMYDVLMQDQQAEDTSTTTISTTTKQRNMTTTSSILQEDLPPLSKPEHYQDRIGRDLRQVAVSIATSVNSVEDWVTVCQQMQPYGGLAPLIDCIVEGANMVRSHRKKKVRRVDPQVEEEAFAAASTACRALRDLCALDLELASVITDGLLRANAGMIKEGSSSLLQDLVTLLQYAHDSSGPNGEMPTSKRSRLMRPFLGRRQKVRPRNPRRSRKEARQRCKLYVTQLLLAMACTSDSAVDAFRSTDGLQDAVLACSSYKRTEQTRRWLRYPIEMVKSWKSSSKNGSGSSSSVASSSEQRRKPPFIEAASLKDDLNGKILGTSNQILAAMGYNQWVPKQPGQKGLRILCLDGGGSRGMTAVTAVDCLVEALDGMEVADCFDFIIGTSTGAIISFLIGLRRESSKMAIDRYDELIKKIFVKTAMSTPLLLFTTATYDESYMMDVLSEILKDDTLLDSRADPSVPFVFAVTSKMSSNPTHVALLRNYNYNGGEYPDPFMIKPDDAREALRLPLEMEDQRIRLNKYATKDQDDGIGPNFQQRDASRHPGSFRVLQRYALRASTAAPTVFKPVMMGGEMYCDGGIVASNPTAIAIHEARSLFPDIPIECVVSLGTGGFVEQKSAPRIGWDGIINQIVNSATDAEQVHHVLEDILGDGGTTQLEQSRMSNTFYARFNPILGLPDEFPIDVTEPAKLEQIKQITRKYMKEPEQQRKLKDLKNIMYGRGGFPFGR
eukprot:CAMPEP_0113628990 /NCGR_PEP_ID=MMETSP0017_2-20120614/15035_1 /TAXON_ID=2856 /ORGANISM="Cylindrotheca closterium" /LENGTH=868 /DNA_ID=CAMNT_0000539343 /DNA_START=252 /DNA_END=2855 /DNA_ORIENTATION=+ /assembly_acc=CAM_ASM_000147